MKNTIQIPLTVPEQKKEIYRAHYLKATHKSSGLFVFAGDQKIEHLNNDFYGKGIPKECQSITHLFQIADNTDIGLFATHLGLIARYGHKYPSIPYLVKLNGKSNIVTKTDPKSYALHQVDEVVYVKKHTDLSILGIGYTIYLGSKYESEMLKEAAHAIFRAHQEGLLTMIWAYPQGKTVRHEQDPQLLAGAAGVVTSLGADFVKIRPPLDKNKKQNAKDLKQIVRAAGTTKVVCAGGPKITHATFLQQLYEQIQTGGTAGCAAGRNIYQNTLPNALRLCNAIAAIIYKDVDIKIAKQLLTTHQGAEKK